MENITSDDTPLPTHRNLLVKLTLPGWFSAVGQRAFKGCANLVWVKTNGDGTQRLATFNTQSFNGCTNLEKVDMGTKVNSLAPNAFSDCPALVTLVINKTTTLTSIKDSLFSGTTQVANIMVYVPDGSITTHSGTGNNTLRNAGIELANIKSINDLALALRPENWQ
jgi:hypothetical protein